MQIVEARRQQARVQVLLHGPPGAGKTLTGLVWAQAMGKRVGVIDTERGRSQFYAGQDMGAGPLAFQVAVLDGGRPEDYLAAMGALAQRGCDVLLIDSLSHAWAGSGGLLERHDEVPGKNSWSNWSKITPVWRQLIEAILTWPGHVIVTARAKTEWATSTNERGQVTPRKLGLGPVARPETEYEFPLIVEIDVDHVARVTKSWVPGHMGATTARPAGVFLKPVLDWIAGVPVDPAAAMAEESRRNKLDVLWKAVEAMPASEQYRHGILQRTGKQRMEALTDAEIAAEITRVGQELARRGKAASTAAATVPAAADGEHMTLQDALQQAHGDALPKAAEPGYDAALLELLSLRDRYYDLCGVGLADEPGGKQTRDRLWAETLARKGLGPLTPLTREVIRDMTDKLRAKLDPDLQGKQTAKDAGGAPGAIAPGAGREG